MTIFIAALILFFGSLFAGCLGAMSGLGGGLIIVPLLVLGLGIDIHYAIGTSLIAVIATSSGSSAAYIKSGYSNIRVGMFLETATTLGAVMGVALGSRLPVSMLFLIFGIVLAYCAFSAFTATPADHLALQPNKLSTTLKLDSSYPSQGSYKKYYVQRSPWGWLIMFTAGALSGILGIGSGALKVVALDKVMKIPFKVSTTTSNFMIGVTAATSAGIYLNLGYIDPFISMPVVIGVTIGAFAGAFLVQHMPTQLLRKVFACLVLIISSQMIYKSFFDAL